MKKNTRTLIILGAVLVICIGAYIGVSVYNSNQARKTAEEARAVQIYANGRGSPVTISYESGGTALSFILTEGKWHVSDRMDFPLNQSSLTGLASAINNLEAVRIIDISAPLSTYGLDNPAYAVTASDDAGNALKLLIGDNYEEYYYAMAEGGDRIYTISSSLVGYLKPDLLSMIVLDTLPVLSESTIDAISLTSGASSLTLDKRVNKDGTYTWLIAEGDAYTAADSYVLPEGTGKLAEKYVREAVKVISSARFTSCAAFNPTGEELAEYGLHEPQLTVTVDYSNSSETGATVIDIGRPLDDGTGYYARLTGSQQICILSIDVAGSLMEALTAFHPGE